MGSAHITARRLGALFEGVCPSTPNLIRAYGTRVSEVAETARDSAASTDGIFSAHTGVNETSIWAAATSSTVALQVQLLACMLARLWGPQEATSVWVKLVKERRTQVAEQYKKCGPLPFSTVTAAVQSEISRSSLAEWDDSARSWLRIADRSKTRQQKQLMLIISNFKVAVNTDSSVLSSVIEA
ncbi:hypothetical protein BBP40_011995 [Aspergillus hancockii]|nr:hypothetical protein BBP40_011995 [Aspergillus hancockii]